MVRKFARGYDLIRSNDGKYYLHNGHGDVVSITNNSGTVIKSYSYDSFGNEKNIDKNDTNPWRYCGEYYDNETGSIYLRARYYDPRTGRFMTEDPARDGVNWYTYCEGNPIQFIDPNGTDAIVITAPDGAGGFGHTSALFEDENGDWQYFYWGNSESKLVKTKLTKQDVNVNKFVEYDKRYTHFVYIEGDFGKSIDYFYEKLEDKTDNEKNENYNLLTRNCIQVTDECLRLGKLTNGKSFSTCKINSSIIIVPTPIISIMSVPILPVPVKAVIPNCNKNIYDSIATFSKDYSLP